MPNLHPGTRGLHKETTLNLGRHGSRQIFFTGRKKDSAEKVIAQATAKAPTVAIEYLQCNQTFLSSVNDTVKRCPAASDTSTLDLITSNAGVMGTEPGLTTYGYENQFATNHIRLLSRTESRR